MEYLRGERLHSVVSSYGCDGEVGDSEIESCFEMAAGGDSFSGFYDTILIELFCQLGPQAVVGDG